MNNWLTGFSDWCEERLHWRQTWEYHMSRYYAPKNFNFLVLLWRICLSWF